MQASTVATFVSSMTLDPREATKTIGRTFNPTRQVGKALRNVSRFLRIFTLT